MAPYDVMLGHELFADGMSDPELAELAGPGSVRETLKKYLWDNK